MRQSRFSDEQMVGISREADRDAVGPDGGQQIELVGAITSLLALGVPDGTKRRPASGEGSPDHDLFAGSVKVVAGSRNHRELTQIRATC